VTRVGIVGPGRAGVALGLALSQAGHDVLLHGRSERDLPNPLRMTAGDSPPWLDDVDVVLLAVPDDAIADAARLLAATGAVAASHTVLHLSGALGSEVLEPLAASGAQLGSFHPYQTMSGGADAAELLRGAAAGVSGSPHAIEAASELARSMGMRPVTVPEDNKVLYHAAAVFASNYLVTLEGVSEELLEQSGLSASDARSALGPLMRAALEHALGAGAKGALTGPVSRGDAATVRRHLDALPPEAARLYRELARATLQLADVPPEQRDSGSLYLRYEDIREAADGGRGYYRNISLLNIWAHAPFMHNNALGPEICGKPATHHVKKWENNIETDYSLCDACAEEKGLAPEGGKESGLAETLGEMLEGMEGVGEGAVGTVECPRCHLPYSSFRQNGRLGCPYCYTAFDKQLRPLLRRVHGAVRHTGKAPSGTDEHAARRQELRRLQDEMERALPPTGGSRSTWGVKAAIPAIVSSMPAT